MSAYIKFDGVDGESKDKGHEKWSDLDSFSQVVHTPGSGATGAARRRGTVMLEDIQCSKLLDKSSPKLAEAVCKGKVFPKVEIHVTVSTTDSGRETYYAYELKNVMVTSYLVRGNSQGKPNEEFSLNFEQIKVKYTETDEAGTKGIVPRLRRPPIAAIYPMTWEDSTYAQPLSDLYYGLGGFTLKSTVEVAVKQQSGNTWSVTFVRWTAQVFDVYNWDHGKSVWVPGWGTIDDADAIRVEQAGRARSYLIESLPWFVTDPAIAGPATVTI